MTEYIYIYICRSKLLRWSRLNKYILNINILKAKIIYRRVHWWNVFLFFLFLVYYKFLHVFEIKLFLMLWLVRNSNMQVLYSGTVLGLYSLKQQSLFSWEIKDWKLTLWNTLPPYLRQRNIVIQILAFGVPPAGCLRHWMRPSIFNTAKNKSDIGSLHAQQWVFIRNT